MNVADQFGEIGIFLTENGLIAILKKLTMAVVPLIEGNRMTREKPGHDPMKGDCAGLEEQMSVIAEECPCIAGGMGVGEYLPHSFDEAIFVDIVAEDQSSLDAPDDDVVEHTFGIETGMTGHSQSYQTERECVNSYLLIYGRPLCVGTWREEENSLRDFPSSLSRPSCIVSIFRHRNGTCSSGAKNWTSSMSFGFRMCPL